MLFKNVPKQSEIKVGDVVIRRGTPQDARGIHETHQQAIHGYVQDCGLAPRGVPLSQEAVEAAWHDGLAITTHLNRIVDQLWVAEREGRIVGVAKSIIVDEVQELTEFFVHPDLQVKGIGQALLSRAFADAGTRYRCIIATIDTNAQILYMRAGVYPRYPNGLFGRKPEKLPVTSSLAMVPMDETPQTIEILASIDEFVLEHRRDVHHRWLLGERDGYLFMKEGSPVGYGYIGEKNGPFALLDPADYVAALTAAESKAADAGHARFDLVVPMVNSSVVDHLLARGFRLDPFHTRFMSDKPFGKFENYIGTSPMYFL